MTFLTHLGCPDYKEEKSIDDFIHNLTPDHVVQLKYDGIWGQIHLNENKARVYSKTGNLKAEWGLSQTTFFNEGPTVLLGEFMYGTEWSQQPAHKGQVFVFDCLILGGRDLHREPYSARYRAAVGVVLGLGVPFRVAPNYHVTKAGGLWAHITNHSSHEGLISRKWSTPYSAPELCKIKREVEDDFVVMGVNEGSGRLTGAAGALLLGQFDVSTGQLVEVMTCGGGMSDDLRRLIFSNPSNYISRVVRVKGNDRFASGALRSPQFVQFRDDKPASACLLKKQS